MFCADMTTIGTLCHETMTISTDTPKSLRHAHVREERCQMLSQPLARPLADLVQQFREELGEGYAMPDLDPMDGGIGAEILFLLEAPGPKAVQSGFISRNNPDETAANFFRLNVNAGIDRKRTAIWNIVPWYIGDGQRIRAADSSDIEAGMPYLKRLLALLPELKTIVFVGRKAERADGMFRQIAPHLQRLAMPHPSPMVINRHPDNWHRLLTALQFIPKL